MVGATGLEPARLSPRDPKSRVSANSTTRPRLGARMLPDSSPPNNSGFSSHPLSSDIQAEGPHGSGTGYQLSLARLSAYEDNRCRSASGATSLSHRLTTTATTPLRVNIRRAPKVTVTRVPVSLCHNWCYPVALILWFYSMASPAGLSFDLRPGKVRSHPTTFAVAVPPNHFRHALSSQTLGPRHSHGLRFHLFRRGT